MSPDQQQEFDDPSIAAVEESAGVAKPVPKETQAIKALIKSFEDSNKPPDHIKNVLDTFSEQREYCHTEANLPTTAGGVSTNYLYKYQLTHKAQVNARQPAISVKPKKRIGQLVPELNAMITGYAETQTALVQHFMSPDEMDIKGVLDGVIQDVDTVGLVFVKLDWLDDMKRDPLGANRPNDFQDTLARLTRLSEAFQANEFGKDDAQYADLQEVTESVKKEMETELWRKMMPEGPVTEDPRKLRWEGVPTPHQITEIPRYRGFRLNTLIPEDCRWDWSITTPEKFRFSGHFSYKTWMDEDEIREFFGLNHDDDLVSYCALKEHDDTSVDQGMRTDSEDPEMGNKYCVWTRMDRRRNRIYNWIEGGSRWLRTPEPPEVVTSNWFNVWPHDYNRASGRFLPVSNTTLGKPLQDEINRVRTHKREGKNAAYDRWAVEGDLFDEDEKTAMEECPPNGMFTTSKKVEDLQKKMMRMPGQYNPAVHDVLEERQELGTMLGQSQASQGVTKGGADSATEAAIAKQSTDTSQEDHISANEALIRNIGQAMCETMNQALPAENAKAIAGPGAFFPMFQREQLWAHLNFEVEAGSTARAQQDRDLAQLERVVEIGAKAGLGAIPGGPIFNAVTIMEKVAKIIDYRDDPKDLIILPQPMPMPMDPAMGGVSGPGSEPMGDPMMPGGPTGAQGAPDQANAAPPNLPMVNAAPTPPALAG
jgi:hypothetical protein